MPVLAQLSADQIEINAAKSHLKAKKADYKLSDADIDQLVVSSAYRSASTGWYHVYFAQMHQGIEVYNAQINVTLKNGHPQHISSSFEPTIPEISSTQVAKSLEIGPRNAVSFAAKKVNLKTSKNFAQTKSTKNVIGKELKASFADNSLAKGPIETKLMWYVLQDSISYKKKATLSYQVRFLSANHKDAWNIHVNAATGEVLSTHNEMIKCDFGRPHSHENTDNFFEVSQQKDVFSANTYHVFDIPVESPSFGARSLVTNPYTRFVPSGTGPGPTNGWHHNGNSSFTSTIGNNVSAQEDILNNDTGGSRPTSSSLDFNYPYSLGLNTGPANRNAAIVNLFYWSNTLHDILYKYGFDETAGNFQTNNLSRGGLGNDHVIADAQDGSGANNANFYTPEDGSTPRMQMYLWNYGSAYQADSDFDNAVIAHEYGHGWSTRLTGGPANSSCLNNLEQAGEGWSDYLGLMLTTNWASTTPTLASANIPRSIATYLLGQATTGSGLRPYRYSYDMANINPQVTYAALSNSAVFSAPHGIGSIWATVLWDMTWEIIFEDNQIIPNIYDTAVLRGNVAALKLVHEGLRLQPCNPSFIDARDAIFAADQALFNGRYRCAIGRAFARRGLGAYASTGASANDRVVSQDFTQFNSNVLSSAKALSVCSGELFNYTATSATAGTVFSWSRAAVAGIANGSSSGSGSALSETLINTTNEAIKVNYLFFLSPELCGSPVSQTVEVSVYPSAIEPLISSYSICQGAAVPVGEGLKMPAEVYASSVSNLLNFQNGKFIRGEHLNTSYIKTSINTYFKTYKFLATSTGLVTFNLYSSQFDCFLSLYEDHFYAQNPEKNYLFADDDGGSGTDSEISYPIVAGKTYILVVGSFLENMTGQFTLTSSESGLTPWFIWSKTADGSELHSGSLFNPVGIDIPNTGHPGIYQYYSYESNSKACRSEVSFRILPSALNAAQNGNLTSNRTVCPIFNKDTLALSGFSGQILGWISSENDFETQRFWYVTNDSLTTNALLKSTIYKVVSYTNTCEVSESNAVKIAVVSPSIFMQKTVENHTETIRAGHYIRSKQKVEPASAIKYQAGRSIELDTSFVVETGSSFTAEILPNTCFIPEILTLQPGPSTGIDTDISSTQVSVNFSNAPYMVPYSWVNFGLPETRRALIKFDFASLPPGAIIDSAFLDLSFSRVFVEQNPPFEGHFGENIFEVRKITGPWQHQLVTWATQPSSTTNGMVVQPAATFVDRDYKHINITEILRDQMVENHGLMIQHQIEMHYKLTALATSNDPNPALRPKLVVYYRYL